MIHQEPPTSPSSDQLALLLVAAGQVPVHRELMDRHRDHWLPDPDRGQLWRLEHAGTAALARCVGWGHRRRCIRSTWPSSLGHQPSLVVK